MLDSIKISWLLKIEMGDRPNNAGIAASQSVVTGKQCNTLKYSDVLLR
jgi:hypothetical protein